MLQTHATPRLRSPQRLFSFLLIVAFLAAFIYLPGSPGKAAPGKLIVGYAAGWNMDSRAEAASLDGSKLSIIIYAFVGINPATNSCTAEWTDPENGVNITSTKMAELMKGLNDNKAENAGLKVLMSIGGGGYAAKFEQLTNYTTFAQSCYDLMVAHGLNGIDVDYEFPETAANRTRHKDILQALNTKLGNNGSGTGTYILTVGAAASDWYAQWLDIANVKNYVDYFTTMAYNYHGSWEQQIHYNSPLEGGGCTSTSTSGLCAVSTAYYYNVTRGVPKSKILLGIGWYGNQYTTTSSCSVTVGSSGYSAWTTIDYNTMRTNGMLSGQTTAGSGWTRTYDSTYKNAKLCNSGNTWIGYEDYTSTKARADWLSANGYPGIMIWELFKDHNGELLKAVCDSFTCSSSPGATATNQPTPATPANFTATVVSANEIQLAWNASTYASSYEIYRCSGSSCTPSLYKTVTTNSYADTSLSATTSYSYYVKAKNTTGTSGASSTQTKTTSAGSGSAPAAPTGLSAAAGSTPGTINLSWSTSANATSYAIYRGTTSGFSVSPGSTAPIATVSANTYSDSGLTGGTTYYYKVAASNSAGFSAATGQVSAVAPKGQNDNSGYPAWVGGHSYKIGDLVSYQGRVYKAKVDHANETWTPTITSVWDDMGVASAATPTPVPATPPGVPQNVAAAAVNATTVNLSWNQVPSATSYKIYRCSGSGCTPSGTEIATVNATGNNPTYSNTGLSAGTIYRYNIKAINSGGTSAASTTVQATTATSCTAPATPTNLSASPQSSSQINVSWNSSSGATSYKLYRGTSSGFTPGGSNMIYSGSSTSYNNTGLTSNTTYYYKVAASNGSCDSAPSGSTTGTTQAGGTTGGGTMSGCSNSAPYPAWAVSTIYATGYCVTYNGGTYKAIQAHTSLAGWDPVSVPAIWSAP